MKAIVRIIIVFSLVWTISRTAVYFLPGDPAEYLVHESLVQISPEVLRQKMVIPTRGFTRVFSFPETRSLVKNESAITLVVNALGKSAVLTLLTLLFSACMTLIILYLSFSSLRWKQKMYLFSALCAAIPLFVSAPLLLLVCSVWLKLVSPIENPLLPTLALSIYLSSFWFRALDQKLVAYLPESSVMGARSRGASEPRAFLKNLLAPSLGGFIAFFGTQIGILFNGSLLVEIIFQWNGVGSLLADSVLSRDYPVIELCLLSVTLITLISQQLGYLLQSKWEPKLQ